VYLQDSQSVVLGLMLVGAAILVIKYLVRQLSYAGPRKFEILLFLALFSGPPRLRARDPMASLHGEIDWVVLLHLLVWVIGAVWVARELLLYVERHGKRLHLHWLHLLALGFSGALGLSVFTSSAPLLSAFRAFQLLVMLLFSYLWVRKFGPDGLLRGLFFNVTVIGLAIVAASLFAPELVYVGTRLRGDLIANAGAIGAIGLIFSLSYRSVPKSVLTAVLLTALFAYILVASFTRSGYAAFLAFLVLVVLRAGPEIKLRIVRYSLIALIPLIWIFSDSIFSWIIRDPDSLRTLSDRTNVWGYLVGRALEQSPFLGFGFYAERTLTLQVNPGIGTAHGAWAAVLGGAGLLGFSLFAAVWISAFYLTMKCFLARRWDNRAFVAASLLAAVSSIGVATEEMVLPSPTGFIFCSMISLLPIISGGELVLPAHDSSDRA